MKNTEVHIQEERERPPKKKAKEITRKKEKEGVGHWDGALNCCLTTFGLIFFKETVA